MIVAVFDLVVEIEARFWLFFRTPFCTGVGHLFIFINEMQSVLVQQEFHSFAPHHAPQHAEQENCAEQEFRISGI
jgi:hypothetical protein